MIGLGGGSLAKFCYRSLPETQITVVEINPHVIALRRDFMVPDDNERFKVMEANGADFVRDTDTKFDVLLVDGYDHQGQPAELCSQSFYENCRRVLANQGVMAVNLHEGHSLYEVFIDRMVRSFDENIVEVVGNKVGNIIVFAGNNIPLSPHALRSNIHSASFSWMQRRSLTTAFFSNIQVDLPLIGDTLELCQNNDGTI
jgi:spermidine synthase